MPPDAHGNFSGRRLVVFGCGYIGSEVARQARTRGLAVTALTRNAAKAVTLRDEGIDAVVADLAGDAWHDRIPGGADFVLNCVSSGGAGLEGYRRSYLEGMNSITAWAGRQGAAGTFVYTSSTSVYPQNGGATVDESAAPGGSERADVLLQAEQTLQQNTGPICRRWFVLRLAGIYGPGRHHLLSQVRTGEIAGVGHHRLNLAHRDDIAAAIWACFLAPPVVAGGTFNVADDGAAPKAEITRWLADRLGLPAPRFTGEPAEGRRTVTPDRVISNARLKSVLGWRPSFPTFRQGYENLLSR